MNNNKLYEAAKEVYAALGVDTDIAIEKTAATPLSIQCWQGDDVGGFENPDGILTGGIQTTGNYPGKARTIDELKSDFDFAASLIPGIKKCSIHAIYLDNQGKKVDRNEIAPEPSPPITECSSQVTTAPQRSASDTTKSQSSGFIV